MKSGIVIASLLASFSALAAESFPGPDWKPAPSPLAWPDAEPGGEISVFASQFPKSLNYYLENNVFCYDLFSMLFESLLGGNPVTLADEPGVAERWEISDDKKTFTFHINPDAKWSDGKPITAEDVAWTFETIMKPENLTGPHKVALERFDPPEVRDARTIVFRAREIHWSNLQAAGGMLILPRHEMADKEFNRIHFEFPVVSGPYRIAEIKEGALVAIARRADWWQRKDPRSAGVYNFDLIKFRFFLDSQNAFEAFKRGEIDVFAVYTARLWATETGGERFDKNWIARQKIHNYNPIGFQGWCMNMRRPPFDDPNVRKAMAHLLDREKMNSTLMYNEYKMQNSYFEDLYTPEDPCRNAPIAFDMDKARQMLGEAGWAANPKTGMLEKDGKPFEFSMLARDAGVQKFYTIYMETLKNVGIAMRIDQKDWASWSKDMDEFNFDMTWAAWSSGVFKDPESMWSSKEADRQSGNNYAGFKNEIIDQWIEDQKTIFDVEQRHEICRRIDQFLTDEVPYILLWYAGYVRLLYWNKFGMPPWVLSKYGDERSAHAYWWYDHDAAADLERAMKDGAALPGRPAEVFFDREFGQDAPSRQQ